jgi:hypothetical protein
VSESSSNLSFSQSLRTHNLDPSEALHNNGMGDYDLCRTHSALDDDSGFGMGSSCLEARSGVVQMKYRGDFPPLSLL